MLAVVALLVWFDLSVPATVTIGRILWAGSHPDRVPFPEPGQVPTYTHGLVRS